MRLPRCECGCNDQPAERKHCAGRSTAPHERLPMVDGVCPRCGEGDTFDGLLQRIEDRATDACSYLADVSEQVASLRADLAALRQLTSAGPSPSVECPHVSEGQP